MDDANSNYSNADANRVEFNRWLIEFSRYVKSLGDCIIKQNHALNDYTAQMKRHNDIMDKMEARLCKSISKAVSEAFDDAPLYASRNR